MGAIMAGSIGGALASYIVVRQLYHAHSHPWIRDGAGIAAGLAAGIVFAPAILLPAVLNGEPTAVVQRRTIATGTLVVGTSISFAVFEAFWYMETGAEKWRTALARYGD